jgi:hypothetical protein
MGDVSHVSRASSKNGRAGPSGILSEEGGGGREMGGQVGSVIARARNEAGVVGREMAR